MVVKSVEHELSIAHVAFLPALLSFQPKLTLRSKQLNDITTLHCLSTSTLAVLDNFSLLRSNIPPLFVLVARNTEKIPLTFYSSAE